MRKRQRSNRALLIEQCLRDAYLERTGEMVDESIKSWFAGKKAKLGQAAKNVKTGISNAVKSVGNAGAVAGRAVKTGVNNAKKGIAHNAKKAIRSVAASGLEKLGASNTAGEIRNAQNQANQNFKYDKVDTSDKFQKGQYGSVADAGQTAERVTLAKQIAKLLGQFKQKGGKLPKIGIDSLINTFNSVK